MALASSPEGLSSRLRASHLATLPDSEDAPTLLILHALVSAGADPSEETIDKAIKAAALLATKSEAQDEPAAKPKRERKPKDASDTPSDSPTPTT